MVRVVPRKGEAFLLDANVLIDFQNADLASLGLFVEKVAPLHVLQLIVDEVEGVTARIVTRLGITVARTTTEEILAVAGRRRGLSLEDALCVETCDSVGYTCVTNDRAVRAECAARGIRRIWGLHIPLYLVRAGAMRRARALRIGQDIARANPAHITDRIMDRFREELLPE